MEVLVPVVGRWVSPNPGEITMTILKMALSRATELTFYDTILTVLKFSVFFSSKFFKFFCFVKLKFTKQKNLKNLSMGPA